MTRTLLVSFLSAIVSTALLAQTPVVLAKKRTTPITINGNPSETEWQFGNNVAKAIVGTPNNTVKYAVLWDSLYLYLAVTVTDSKKFNDSPSGWDDDAVEIFIDADNNGGTAYDPNDRQFVKEWKSASLWEKNNKTANVQHAWANITNGYAIEMRIPWSSIGITKPAQGFTIGFDVANDDDDNGGTRESQLQWAGDSNNWQYPQNFGDLVLSSIDTQAPSVPANVTASAITPSSLALSWVASTDNVAVSGYDVYQNNVKANTANITTNTYNVTGLAPSTLYGFYVIAKDAAGNASGASSLVNVTTGAPDTQPPTAPSSLSANNMGQTFFTLLWNASVDEVGVAGYDIYSNGTKANTAMVTSTSYRVTGLGPATTYALAVVALDAASNASAASATLNVTTLLPTTGSETFTQRTIIANQRMPHDLVYGPDNNIWYTERFGGTVSFVNPANGVKKITLSLGARMVRVAGQDGLMGLALHPQFNSGKPYVYISYTYQSTSATVRKIRIERYSYNSATQTLESPVTILENIPGSNDHNSARLAVGPDLKLYYTAGDMGAGQFDNIARTNNAQNLDVPEGKMLRLNTELTGNSWIPADNPFSNTGGITAVYTFGHRNPQGLVWGNVNGANILYSSEHGPYSDDELNVIEAGRNYGWPQVAGFCDGNYNGRTIGGYAIVSEQNNCTALNVREPIRSLFPVAAPPTDATNNMTWPSTAPSGIEFYGSTAIPGWQNSLLVAQLKAGAITRFKLSNDGLSIISDTIHYFRGKGRFRDVVVSPDGLRIYAACDSSGSTSGPTGGVTSTPANPGSILEFAYQAPVVARTFNQAMVNGIITEDKKDQTIDVYPNPANDFIIVYNYASQAGRSIELNDMAGKIVRKQTAGNLTTRIATGQLAGGLYILKVRDANGNIIRMEKILIQH